MTYTHRLATIDDAPALAPLWHAFATERAAIDPSMVIQPHFDFEQYIQRQLTQPHTYGWALEHAPSHPNPIVGCLFIYGYDETPDPTEAAAIQTQLDRESPFVPRRVLSALGLYVQPQHRHPRTIKQLIDAGIHQAESLQVSDIDLLIAADQTGIQALLDRAGFQTGTIEYVRNYDIAITPDLPSLHPPDPNAVTSSNSIQLLHPSTQVKSMSYTCRLATVDDASALAPLWQAFAAERATQDPSMAVKPAFDYERYLARQLAKPLACSWVIEHPPNAESEASNPDLQPSLVGCLLVYFYDEAPPPSLPQDLLDEHRLDNPFTSRRVGSVLGLYVHPDHRKPEAIQLLADAALQQAEALKVTDIDLLVGNDQSGIHALLERIGFTRAAVQYTKHYDLPASAELPSLHPPHPELEPLAVPVPSAIPLRDPKTNQVVCNPQGDPVFLSPLKDESGELLKTAAGLPIYPTPVRDPQTQDWAFDGNGTLVVCPLLQTETSQVVEYNGMPQFHPPTYERRAGKLCLKQDEAGNYQFCPVERDATGDPLCAPDGRPLFQQPLPQTPIKATV